MLILRELREKLDFTASMREEPLMPSRNAPQRELPRLAMLARDGDPDRIASLAWEVRPWGVPPYFFQNVVIPLGLPFGVGKRCDSKGVKYKDDKLGLGYATWRADGIRSGAGAGTSGCTGRMK